MYAMPRNLPVASELRPLYVLPQLAVLVAAIGVCIAVLGDPVIGAGLGALIYVAYSFGSRTILAKHQRAGMRHYQQRQWSEALTHFKRSQAFFEQYPWIDRYRQVLLMSPSGVSYHEMALVNQGSCLIHMNCGLEARRTIERALGLYPDSTFAEGILKTMDAGIAASQSASGE